MPLLILFRYETPLPLPTRHSNPNRTKTVRGNSMVLGLDICTDMDTVSGGVSDDDIIDMY